MKKLSRIITQAGIVLTTGVVTLGIVNVAAFNQPGKTAHASVQMNPAYDLSEWQKSLTDSQVQQLKKEASFLIIRVQYGSNYADKVYQNNIKLLDKYNVPYGVYSFSLYNSVAQAQGEAQTLYKRVPNARFYVNDLEQQNGMSSATLDAATSAWAAKMRTLTSRPVVLYSGQSFMTNNIGDSKNDYDTLWLASYGAGEPNPSYTYGLWQFTDQYHSTALNQNIDASVIPDGGEPMSFWVGSGANTTTASSSASVSSSASSSAASSSSSASGDTIYSDGSTNTTTSLKKHSVNKKKKVTVSVLKPKVNTALYYSSKSIKRVEVTATNGIYVYNSSNHRVKHLKKGTIIDVASFKQQGTKTIAMSYSGTHFTANKHYIRAINK